MPTISHSGIVRPTSASGLRKKEFGQPTKRLSHEYAAGRQTRLGQGGIDMASTGVAFAREDQGDSRFASDSPLKLVGNSRILTEEVETGSGLEMVDAPLSRGKEYLRLDEEIGCEAGFEGIVGKSAALRKVLQRVQTVAAI